MFDESDKYQTAATSNRQLNNEEFSKNNMGFVMVRKSEVSPKKMWFGRCSSMKKM
jgi:hypothetical protein